MTKLCSGVSAADASIMARELRCDPEFIMSQPRLQFATYIRHVTPSAVSVPMPLLDNPPQRDDYHALLKRNRERVSLPPRPVRQPVEDVDNHQPAEPDEDISEEW